MLQIAQIFPKTLGLQKLMLACICLPLAACIWLYSQPMWINGAFYVVNTLIGQNFTQSQAHLERNGETWVVGTKILLKDQPEDKSRRRYQYLKLNDVSPHFLTLPILWSILWALSPFNGMLLLQGTVILYGIIIAKIGINVLLQITRLLEVETGAYVELVIDNYQMLRPTSHIWVLLLQTLQMVITVITLIAPIWISYFFRAEQIKTWFNR